MSRLTAVLDGGRLVAGCSGRSRPWKGGTAMTPFSRSQRPILPREQLVRRVVGLIYLVILVVFFTAFIVTHLERPG